MHCDLSNIGDIAKGFASLSSTYLTVYQLEKYDPFRYSQPPKNNVLLKVPMMFATNDTKVAKAGLLKTKSVHVLRIKSGIENVGIDLLFWDTSKDKSDIDVIRENHRFLWDEVDETKLTWDQQLAKKYYEKVRKLR